jgi:septum formation inhibitor MinC
MTPREAAKKAGGNMQSPDVDIFLLNASPREIQEFINHQASVSYTHWLERAKVALNIALAEQQAKSAEMLITHTEKLTQQTDKMVEETVALKKIADEQKVLAKNLEKQTTTLIRLTWAIVILTLVLVVKEVIMLFGGGH